MNEKNILPKKDDVIEEHDEKVMDVLASNSILWLHFNGS